MPGLARQLATENLLPLQVQIIEHVVWETPVNALDRYKFRPEVRPAERDANCRACTGPIKKGELMVSWFSPANRGQHIHIHMECGKKIGDITNGDV